MVTSCPLSVGSPPPAWGKRLAVLHLAVNVGFTPTRVGEAGSLPRPSLLIRVHPHPRGESTHEVSVASSSTGSPPPAWGKQQPGDQSHAPEGFTPTRVGKAAARRPKSRPRRVHPHPRGESSSPATKVTPQKGSPPPAWGKQQPGDQSHAPEGFTPTRVGKAIKPLKALVCASVHPHPRGESDMPLG